MKNELKQQISGFLDDELDTPAALKLLGKARDDSEMAITLNRYAAISQAMKGNGFILDDGCFLKKVSAQIQQEPTHLLPKRNKQDNQGRRYRILAAAASIATVVVLGAQSLNQPIPDKLDNASLAVAGTSYDEDNPKLQTKKPDQPPLNQRIYDYLQAHNNMIYTSGDPSLQPVVKTAYSKNR